MTLAHAPANASKKASWSDAKVLTAALVSSEPSKAQSPANRILTVQPMAEQPDTVSVSIGVH